ncbi:MAG: hypothetical protein AABZ92_04035 [Verrucomicrobiota bacterium]
MLSPVVTPLHAINIPHNTMQNLVMYFQINFIHLRKGLELKGEAPADCIVVDEEPTRIVVLSAAVDSSVDIPKGGILEELIGDTID